MHPIKTAFSVAYRPYLPGLSVLRIMSMPQNTSPGLDSLTHMQVPSIAPAAKSWLMTPSRAPAADAFMKPPVTGAPLSVTAGLAPGTVAVIAPPAYGNASLPGELPMPQLLASFVAPYLGVTLEVMLHCASYDSTVMPKQRDFALLRAL